MHYPRKRFGQHFLHDPIIIQKIVDAMSASHLDHVVEIGPGLGAITVPLLTRCKQIEVIELDRDVIPTLRERCRELGNIVIHNRDALRFDFGALAHNGQKIRLVGNLPYNISTPLLFHLLDYSDYIADMHFTLQKEVAERMAATEKDKAYGRLSVMLARCCSVTPLFEIGSGAFRPAPKVTSSFVRLQPLEIPAFTVDNPRLFATLVARAFSMRRKTIRNALKGMVDEVDLESADVDPTARPETVSPRGFAALANRLAAKSG